MPVNAFIFTYSNTAYSFNAKALNESLYKVQFLQPVQHYGLPQHFLLNTSQVMVFLPEEPNAVYYTTREAHNFLKHFAADLDNYMLEFA